MEKKTKKIVGVGLLTAVVIVLQALATAMPKTLFELNLVLVPMVVGAALYGYKAGAWLGLVFSVMVLIAPGTSVFYAINVPATIATVVVKGTMAGLVAGAVYVLINKWVKNAYVATVVAAIVSPIVNTGIFLLGCYLFFLDGISVWEGVSNYASTVEFIILAVIGTNFLVEMAINIVLSPVIVRIIRINKKAG